VPSNDAWAPRPRVPLAGLTSLGIGGSAAWFARASTAEDVDRLHRWCADANLPMLVLGGGSNLVVADRGFEGCVVRIELRGRRVAADGGDLLLTAGAGEPWDDLVADAVSRGLAGLECLSGIPGSVGGTPIQNVGAYGQEVATTIERLLVYDRAASAVRELTAAECGFSYRMSRFKGADAGRFIVCEVTFRLRQGMPAPTYPDLVAQLTRSGGAPTLAGVREAVLAIRRRKGMVIDPADPDSRSVGSFFMNPVVSAAQHERIGVLAAEQVPAFPAGDGRVKVPAAWLIERAGFHKGLADGAVGISSKHPLALVNRGDARAADVLRLATRIKRGVLDRFAVALRPEPVFAGFHDEPELAFLLSPRP
jgi:UDP-N-acetylmuramate dehydrogenase